MKYSTNLTVAVAETSPIIRSGMVSVLKELPDLRLRPVEIASTEALQNFVTLHKVILLIVNPHFGGFVNLNHIRKNAGSDKCKIIAIDCGTTDNEVLKQYDDRISLYDSVQTILNKITALLHCSNEEEQTAKQTLSKREEEIVCCVVKGLTNKEIAEQLYISVHTVMTHRRNIARKLQIHSATGLTIYALINKLVDLSEIKTDL